MGRSKSQFQAQVTLLKYFPMIAGAVATVLPLLGMLIGWTVWITKNVPQTPYVEELFSKQIKYVDSQTERTVKYIDDKINNLRTESFAHSDFNRSSMESEYKGLSAKLDMLILIVQQQRQGNNSGSNKK